MKFLPPPIKVPWGDGVAEIVYVAGSRPVRPSDFTIGSVESRAAAREELRRRISHDFSDATVMISTGLPRFTDGPPVATPPDFIEYRVASDGSIVEVIHRYWQGDRESGLTICHRSDVARRESLQRQGGKLRRKPFGLQKAPSRDARTDPVSAGQRCRRLNHGNFSLIPLNREPRPGVAQAVDVTAWKA